MARRTPLVVFDANEIAPGLWQGSYPDQGSFLFDSGFDVVVLCAKSYQPPASRFPGLVDVVHAPAYDDTINPISRLALGRALEAAKIVSNHIRADRNVLVTCQAGLNRSGLVSALTLHLLYGWSGATCIERVQQGREGALFNERFVEALGKLQARPGTRKAHRHPQGT